MSDLPYDPDNPPCEPPEGCSDPLLWTIARALRRAHGVRPDGFCECKNFWPCPMFTLADETLQTAYLRPWGKANRSSGTNTGRWSE
jgi:hypothetical protein